MMGLRAAAMRGLDRLRFQLLTTRYLIDRPRTHYQPLPFMGITETRRSVGCQTRLTAMRAQLATLGVAGGTVVDYGCNIGFFSLSLAQDGFVSYGVDESDNALSLGYTVARLKGLPFFPVRLRVERATVDKIPNGDVGICLSIWHHWVKQLGLDEATFLLRQVYAKSARVVFFDTGELEVPASFNLPFQGGDPRAWLEAYFHRELAPSAVVWLGAHKAFRPGGGAAEDDGAGVTRNLFALVK